MNISQLKRFLPYAIASNNSVMIHGLHGIGKSQTVKQFAQEMGMEFVDRRLSQMESGDLLGLPTLENGRTSFMPPDWLPRDPESRGILFLDEINRARKDVLQGVFQLVLDRELGNYKLPKGWAVVTAINPDTEDYDVTNVFDAALMDRFLHVKLSPSTEEFISFLRTDKSSDQNIVSFLQAREDLIENGKLTSFTLSDIVKPSRRSWQKAAMLAATELNGVKLPEDLFLEGVGGLVGINNANMYQTWLVENDTKPFTAEDILKNYKKNEAKIKSYSDAANGGRHDILQASLDNLKTHISEVKGKLTDKQVDNLLSFVQVIPKDLFTAFITSGLDAKDNASKEFYVKLLDRPETDALILTNEKQENGKTDFEMIAELEALVEQLKKEAK